MIDGRHLEPDDASAEHQHALGDEIDLERRSRIPDARVGGNESGRGWFGAGGDDRLVEAHHAGPFPRFNPQRIGRGERALPGQRLDLALLGEAGQAARQPLDHAVLPAADRARVEGRRAKAHAVRAHRLGVVDDLGDMQERLGRDAADVEADAAQRRARVDQNDVLSEIGGAEGGGVAAGTGAQDQNIGLEIGLAAWVGGGLRGWGRRRGLRGRLLDFDAAALRDGRRSGGFRRLRRRGSRLSSARIGRQQVALADLVADLDADLADHAILGRRHVHARLVAFERQDRLVLADALPGRNEDLDDRHILEVADVGEPDFFRHACLSIGPRSQDYAPHVLQEAREMAHEASGRSAVDHPVIVR